MTSSQGAAHFAATILDRRTGHETFLPQLTLPMPGEHNVQNALAAIAVAAALGIDPDRIREALAKFAGVTRRFTRVGEWHGAAIIDDYAHNPFKIAAALKAARQAYAGPIVAVVQPHRYTGLRDTFEQFATCLHDSDTAIVAPVYAAGEQPLPGFDRDTFADSLRAHGHRHVLVIDGPDDLPPLLAQLAKPGGAIVCLGAGSITHWAAGLELTLKQMEARA